MGGKRWRADYSTTYFLDALIGDGGAFEFKTVDVLTPRHHGQLYNYLLLLDLAHGKLVNLRPESVTHEFVNATLRPDDRRKFTIVAEGWNRSLPGADLMFESTVELLRDWGTGLENEMYESALTAFLGGEEHVLREVAVHSDGHSLGTQIMRLAGDGVAFRLTAFDKENPHFEEHARRLLRHVDLCAILWVNIGLRRVAFTSLERSGL
jgi:hypothetical protein